MYKNIKKFPKPDNKILYSYFDDFKRVLIEFSKRNIYIYDFKRLTYIIIYDVLYEIEDLHLDILYYWSIDAVYRCPKNLFHLKFYEWIRKDYQNNFFRLHCYDIVRPEDDPFEKVGDFKKYCQELEKNWIW